MLYGMEHFDILIYAAITVFLLSRLWAVLGQRDDDSPDRPQRPNPFGPPDSSQADEEDVMVLEGKARTAQPSLLTVGGHAPASLAGALEQIRTQDHTFDEKKFLDGARAAFVRIVGCFAVGDLTPVAWLLGPSVRHPFDRAIEARKAVGQTLENRIEKIVAADIVGAKLDGSVATISVEFVSHQVNLLRDATGQILDGTPGQTEEVRDFWILQRDVRSPDPNWQLVETRS